MSDFDQAQSRTFRLAAPRVFIFLAAIGYPGFVIMMFIRYGVRIDWQPFVLGAACLVPTLVILAGVVSLFFPISLTSKGVQAQNAWGMPSFVRWQDIGEVRPFVFLNLRWLRLYSSADRSVTWLAVFQSPALEFKREMERLAPAGCPVLKYLE